MLAFSLMLYALRWVWSVQRLQVSRPIVLRPVRYKAVTTRSQALDVARQAIDVYQLSSLR